MTTRGFNPRFDPIDVASDEAETMDQESAVAEERAVAEVAANALRAEEDPAVATAARRKEILRLRRLRAAEEFIRDAALEKFVRDATRGRAGSRAWVKTRSPLIK